MLDEAAFLDIREQDFNGCVICELIIAPVTERVPSIYCAFNGNFAQQVFL